MSGCELILRGHGEVSKCLSLGAFGEGVSEEVVLDVWVGVLVKKWGRALQAEGLACAKLGCSCADCGMAPRPVGWPGAVGRRNQLRERSCKGLWRPQEGEVVPIRWRRPEGKSLDSGSVIKRLRVIKHGVRVTVPRTERREQEERRTFAHVALRSQTQPGLVRISCRGCHLGQIYYTGWLIKRYWFHFVLQQAIPLLGTMSNLMCPSGMSNKTASLIHLKTAVSGSELLALCDGPRWGLYWAIIPVLIRMSDPDLG